MSGDVTLIDSGDGGITRLVHVASQLFGRPGFGSAALVGGLAVTIRLATVHRATNDVDTVADGEISLEYIGERDVSEPGRVRIDGVKVDVMPTSPLPDRAEELPDGELDRLFVLGHRWALESAEAVTLRVVRAGEAAEPTVTHRLEVAMAPALVACKFHAISDRRDARSAKRESDAVDLVRLIADLVRVESTVERYRGAPFDLPALVVSQTRRWLIEDATRMARLVSLGSEWGAAPTDPDEIATVGELFVEALRRA